MNDAGASDVQVYWLSRGRVCLAITSQAIQDLLRCPSPAMTPASNDLAKFANAGVKLRRLELKRLAGNSENLQVRLHRQSLRHEVGDL